MSISHVWLLPEAYDSEYFELSVKRLSASLSLFPPPTPPPSIWFYLLVEFGFVFCFFVWFFFFLKCFLHSHNRQVYIQSFKSYISFTHTTADWWFKTDETFFEGPLLSSQGCVIHSLSKKILLDSLTIWSQYAKSINSPKSCTSHELGSFNTQAQHLQPEWRKPSTDKSSSLYTHNVGVLCPEDVLDPGGNGEPLEPAT